MPLTKNPKSLHAKKFQKSTCKTLLACFESLIACMTSVTPRYSLIAQNFKTS